ncbi:MAG: DMT family transporter [Eubacteriales bacterium]|nr:DMT family transporter [Eubacteriales bacterium]
MKKSTRAELLLLLTAFIWGVAFVAQDVASDSLQPLSFNGIRMALAAVVVLAFLRFRDRKKGNEEKRVADETGTGVPFRELTGKQKRTLVTGGVCCGVLLAASSYLQQSGIAAGSSAGKAGFITALYIVLVPLVGLLFGKKLRLVIGVAVALSVVGLYLLCITDGYSIQSSDVYLILCALGFTGHILVVDHFSRLTDCVKMSCIQFFVTSGICLFFAFLLEQPSWDGLKSCLIPVLYSGILSGGVGYTLQIVSQKDTDPTIASLLMCLESVFAVLAGWIILGDQMSVREYIGCFAMLCGILLAQWPEKKALKQTAQS